MRSCWTAEGQSYTLRLSPPEKIRSTDDPDEPAFLHDGHALDSPLSEELRDYREGCRPLRSRPPASSHIGRPEAVRLDELPGKVSLVAEEGKPP